MGIRCRWILLLSMLLAAAARLFAASSAENRAYSAATNAFQLGFYDTAEAAFAAFAQTYSNSTRVPAAILYQAEARIQQTNYAGAITLLSARQGAAGTNADQYLFWLGEAHLRSGDYRAATDDFASLIEQFPASPRRLEAGIGEATALASLSNWPALIERLQRPDGVFQRAVGAGSSNQLVCHGYVLLSQAYLAQADYSAAEAALEPLAKLPLDRQPAWQRQFLLCQIALAKGQPEEALALTTNLMTLATSTGRRSSEAESAAFRAALLERLGRTDEAIAAYQQNLTEGVPATQQRWALWKITKLYLATNSLTEAAQVLQRFLDRYPQARSADMALLTLGEVRLREFVTGSDTNQAPNAATNAATATNSLQLALGALQELTKRFPQSPLLGQAQLNLGWCFWLADSIPECLTNFQAAAAVLPHSADQATARFKLADSQFRVRDYQAAITNYNAVIEGFRDLPEVETNLFEPALYQIAQAGLAAGDLKPVTNALTRLLAWYPRGFHTDHALLLAGQEVSRQGNPAQARQMFLAFTKAAPDSSLRPAVELAVARTYEQEGQWTNAINQYDHYLNVFTNAEIRPPAEFYRAQATFRTGDLTNALALFTNFVARFPTNEFTPLAQMWVGNYYFRAGQFVEAEKSFKWLFQTNWPESDLTYQAQMMAGRAAFARQAWGEARGYFNNLYNTTRCATDLRIQALLACGDCYMSQDSTNRTADYQEAFKYYNRICELYPSNRLAALAWGGKANALLQWAKSSQLYDDAASAFQQVIAATNADVAARSQARVGLAVTLEKQADQTTGTNRTALLSQALTNCLDVFTGSVLRDHEKPDLFWQKEAGLMAGHLAEQLQEWDQARNVYAELKALVPALASRFEASIRRCEEHRSRDRN